MITFDDVTFIYDGKPLIEHFSYSVKKGEKAVLFGPSGQGKSTLLTSIAGFIRPSSGTIKVMGYPVVPLHINEIRKNIAWLPQEFYLPFETVKEMIESPFRLRSNRNNLPAKSVLMEYFDSLALEHNVYTKRPSEISGGQRQRVMLIITALLKKKIVLLDEPTSALDHESVDRTVNFINDKMNATVVMVSHDSRFIESFGQKIKIGD
ncbi:MAG: ATP-binding cassette domain-containing protein [Barnesiella sp.]